MKTLDNILKLREKATFKTMEYPENECDTFGDCPIQFTYNYEDSDHDRAYIVALANGIEEIAEYVKRLESAIETMLKVFPAGHPSVTPEELSAWAVLNEALNPDLSAEDE